MKTEKEILALFDKWNDALHTGNPDNVVDCYAKDAILLPTVSNQVRHNHQEIRDYFVHFLKKQPNGRINESNIRIIDDIAINSGRYTFSLKENDEQMSVEARYTFVYQNINNEWLIIEHHSSAAPEG